MSREGISRSSESSCKIQVSTFQTLMPTYSVLLFNKGRRSKDFFSKDNCLKSFAPRIGYKTSLKEHSPHSMEQYCIQLPGSFPKTFCWLRGRSCLCPEGFSGENCEKVKTDYCMQVWWITDDDNDGMVMTTIQMASIMTILMTGGGVLSPWSLRCWPVSGGRLVLIDISTDYKTF